MDSKYLPYAVLGLAIIGGIVYLNVEVRGKTYSAEEFASFASNYDKPCDLGYMTKDKDGKPVRRFFHDECIYQLQGIYMKDDDCYKKNAKGGSWGYECSLMNK